MSQTNVKPLCRTTAVYRLLLHKIQRNRVDAIAKPCWWRSVRENVALVASTAGAFYFCAVHAVGAIGLICTTVYRNRLVKRGPASA